MDYKFLKIKKEKVNTLKQTHQDDVKKLDHWFDTELTYISNTINDQCLTRAETAALIQQGLAVGSKPWLNYLQAINYYQALTMIRQWGREPNYQWEVNNIYTIYHRLFNHVNFQYADGTNQLPTNQKNPIKHTEPSEALKNYIHGLTCEFDDHPIEGAAWAYYQFLTISPFEQDHHHIAILMMNLWLLRQGFPPAFIRVRDYSHFNKILRQAQQGGHLMPFIHLIAKAVERALDIYLDTLKKPLVRQQKSKSYQWLRIGKLAELGAVSVPTIRHWLKCDLLQVIDTTDSGYQ